MKKFIKKLFCKHEWEGRGFSYARCALCDKSKYAPEIAIKRINNFINSMVNERLWDKEETKKAAMKRGHIL